MIKKREKLFNLRFRSLAYFYILQIFTYFGLHILKVNYVEIQQESLFRNFFINMPFPKKSVSCAVTMWICVLNIAFKSLKTGFFYVKAIH